MGNQRSKFQGSGSSGSPSPSSASKMKDELGKEQMKATSSSSKPHNPGEGIRSLKTSGVFRALNFELYAKPSKPIMIVGTVAFTLCIGYLVYMRNNYDKRAYYESLSDEGDIVLRPKKSRWDS